MRDPFITAINSQNAALHWFEDLSENVSNMYTPGFREKRMLFSDFVTGSQYRELPVKVDQGKAIPGRSPSNLFIEGKGMFVVRKDDGNLLYTRLGDFVLDKKGTLVNDKGFKLQGYMTDEKGNILSTGATQPSPGGSANNPNHAAGGPGHMPTTEINLWVDPTNGKIFGKYDEYKVKGDGTVLGLADNGKVSVPLFKVALVGFTNPSGLTAVDDYYYVPSPDSGEPIAGEGEILSGMLEASNTGMRENVNYLQQAKLQLEIAQKLISTNKNLLQESMRLIQ